MISTDKKDMYKTPKWCYRALDTYINWDQNLTCLEPCGGDGRIVEWLHVSKNLNNVKYNEPSVGGIDFLKMRDRVDLIISNPPYSLAEEFVRKGFIIAQSSCWLLRLSFLASQKRKQLFIDHPLDALYIISKRPAFEYGPYNYSGGTDNSEYAWFIWDKANLFNKHGIVHL